MKRGRRITLLVLAASLAIAGAYAGWTRVRSPVAAASADSYRLWIALIKGFEGDVHYVGSDNANAFFRVGRVFWSYYKIPACAADLPSTFPLNNGNPYVVRLHVGPDNTVHASDTCVKHEGYALGKLDKVV